MSLTLKEMKIKTTILLEWVSSRIQTTTDDGKGLGKMEPSYATGGNIN
jgi:hypothetical protein